MYFDNGLESPPFIIMLDSIFLVIAIVFNFLDGC
jgi:hypothetical protein